MDPIGLGFETFDGIGAFRTMDGLGAVDATGNIVNGGPDLDGAFNGPVELAKRLADSQVGLELHGEPVVPLLDGPDGDDQRRLLDPGRSAQAFDAVGRQHPRAARARRAQPRLPQRPPHTGELIIMARRLRFDVSRRRLLQALGLGAAAGPLIPLLNASAQTAPRPKRLVLLFTPDGAPAKDYSHDGRLEADGHRDRLSVQPAPRAAGPVQGEDRRPLGTDADARAARASSTPTAWPGLWTGTTLPEPNSGASFDGGNGHLTGWGAAPSIDQIVAQAYGAAMPYQKAPDGREPGDALSIDRARRPGGNPTSVNRMCYTAANAPITPEVSPKAAFDRYFMGVTPSGMTPTEDPAVTRARAEKHAVVDLLKGDLARIRKQVGSADYQKIDAHLAGVMAMERRIMPPPTTPTTTGCTIPTAPTNLTANNANYPTQITQMMDVATHILACDVTRVLTLQLSHGFSGVTHTWLGHTSPHHTMSHDGMDRRTELTAIDNWYAQQVAYFLGQLDAINEGNGTLLDNTLIVWGRELGNTSHNMGRTPFIMAGKAGGGLRTGRFLNFDGKEHAKLLVAVAQLMGLSSTTMIGDRQTSAGPSDGPRRLARMRLLRFLTHQPLEHPVVSDRPPEPPAPAALRARLADLTAASVAARSTQRSAGQVGRGRDHAEAGLRVDGSGHRPRSSSGSAGIHVPAAPSPAARR